MNHETITFNGYCKVRNETRDMHFVYEVDGDEYCLMRGDCDFEHCRYNGECSVIRQAFAKEEEE